MKMMNNYYDTCSLLIKGKDIKKDEHILISSITIDELENTIVIYRGYEE